MSDTRVVVVGGGVAGAAAGYALARRGVSVTLVDAGHEGQATAAGAGIVEPWSTARDGPFYDLYSVSAERYPTLSEELAELGIGDIGYRRCGALVVNADAAVLDEVESRVRERALTAPLVGELTRVESAGARALFPPLAPDLTGLHIAGGARVDGRLLRDGLQEALRRLGGTVLAGHAAFANDSVVLSVDGARLDADAIVLAGGAWTNDVLAPLGLHVPVEPQRGQISHLRLDGVDTTRWPSLSPVSDHYMVAFDDRVVVGATRETGSGFVPRITAAGQRHVLDNALRLAPGLRDATLIETRVGLRPLASDGLPVIGRFDGHHSLVLVTGFGPSGLTIAPYVGDQVANLVLGESPSVDLTPFTPSR